MSNHYIGQIILFAGSYVIQGFGACDGHKIPIAQQQSLFSLIGTAYGGDGRSNFAVPDLQGRAPIGQGQAPGGGHVDLGENTGHHAIALSQAEMPAHTHGVGYSGGAGLTVQNSTGDQLSPSSSAYIAQGKGQTGEPVQIFSDGTGNEQTIQGGFDVDKLEIQSTGSGKAFDPSAPRLALNFLIAMTGVYPPRS